MKLLADLNIILDGLKMNYENNKVYHDILSLINSCLSLIENKTIVADTNLGKDIKALIDIIIPYLGDDKYLKELKAIFEEQKQIISASLENMENLNSKVNGKYKTIDEFELSVRKKLHPYLKSIYFEVANKNTLEEIIMGYKEVITSNYHESKYNIAKVYLSTINELSTYIKANGSEKDIEDMNKILKTMDENTDLDATISQLIAMIKALYRINLAIDEKINNQKLKEEYTINLEKIKVK